MTRLSEYELYMRSVQNPEFDARLLQRIYKSYFDIPTSGLSLREDFCGTGALCYEWIRLNKSHSALGVDLDHSAIKWGKSRYDIQNDERVSLREENVFSSSKEPAHLVCALNFSYFLLKTRADLVRYFKKCRTRLHKNGVLALDAFGGPGYLKPTSELRTKIDKNHSVYWNINSFDAINQHIKCSISLLNHATNGKRDLFKYDWRLWNPQEITECLMEAGFQNLLYWSEGLNKKGNGNGKFRQIKSEMGVETWLIYITATK